MPNKVAIIRLMKTHPLTLLRQNMLVLFCSLCLLSGLRKLEAFFGFLITVMAVSFGYEVHLNFNSASHLIHCCCFFCFVLQGMNVTLIPVATWPLNFSK